MRRTARTIVCLFIGAVMTVGVAWGCALTTTWPGRALWSTSDAVESATTWPLWNEHVVEEPTLPVDVAAGSSARTLECTTTHGLVATKWEVELKRDQGERSQVLLGYGFPLSAMCKGYWSWFQPVTGVSRVWLARGAMGGYSFIDGFGGQQSGWEVIAAFRLPVLPLYFGFTVNTLFYAAITYGLWSLLATAIAWRRLSHGKCPTCKYALGPSPICTECGTKIPGRAIT